MSQISFGEKVSTLWKMISSSYLYLFVLAFFIILIYLFVTTNRSNQKQSKMFYLFLYFIVFVIILMQYGTSIYSFFDYLMNNLAILFYFPNLSTYFIMIVITNIVLWVSIFHHQTDKNIKIMNSISFCVLHYLLFLILEIVKKQKLDVFTLESLYSSKEAMSLIELSNFLFLLWISLLLVYKIIKIYQTKKGIIKIQSFGGYELKQQFDLKKAYLQENRMVNFHEGYQSSKQIEAPKLETPKQEVIEEPFTLEDYRILLELLQDYKNKEEKKQKKQEEPPVAELAALYRSLDQ